MKYMVNESNQISPLRNGQNCHEEKTIRPKKSCLFPVTLP